MTDIVERLLAYVDDDHERGCKGREYDCSCGYDERRDPLMVEAAKTIENLRHEVTQWVNHAKTAIWSDSEECKLLTDENKRLRAALELIESITVHSGGDIHGVNPKHWEAAFQEAQAIARAALGEQA